VENTIASVLVKAKRNGDKIIVCDDGSYDLTPKIAEALGAEVLYNTSICGYGAALGILFKRAAELNPNVMVTLDADGQHDADQIPRLVKPVLDGEADIVIGSRFLEPTSEGAIGGYRRRGIKTITKLTGAASGLNLTDGQSGFRAYSRNAIQKIAPVELGMGASVEIIMKAAEEKLRVKEVPVSIRYNVPRPSTHSPLYHGLDVIASVLKVVSLRHPLMFYGLLGLTMVLFGLGFAISMIQYYAAQARPITNIALLSMAIVSSGLLLIFTAIILFTLTNLIKENV
jgi:glycosyltransferase involved in cell wall biosynthesis